jgi:hypothetical protein
MKQQDHIKNFWNDSFLPWYASRGRYMNYRHKDTLFKFLPSTTAPEREHLNDPLCAAFGLAMEAELDRNPHGVMLFALSFTDGYKLMSIKRYIHEHMGDSVSRQTAGQMAIKSASTIYQTAVAMQRMWELMNKPNFQFAEAA